MNLHQFIRDHTERNACRCGSCLIKGEDKLLPEHTANMVFFDVAAKNNPTKEEFSAVIKEHRGEFCEVDIFDGKEHSYLELGAWAGDQGLALQLMGLGTLLKMWDLLTPFTVLGSEIPADLAIEMAGMGFVSIQVKNK